MKHFKFLITAFVVAFVMALLEVQIEGSNGWAANLPTWRINNFNVFGLIGYINKPITGYHLYLWLYSFLLVHITFLFNKWTFKKELYLLSFYVVFTTLEGILWFIINPAYGLRSLLSGSIPWYKEASLLYLPVEYWIRFAIGLLLYKLYLHYEKKKKD